MHGETTSTDLTGLEIAIIGMAGRFPGAPDIDTFWRNIRDGVESVTQFTDEQLRARGVPEAQLDDPAYVKAGVVFEGFDQFDAGLFGYTPRDAEQLDPQQRIFLECAWAALEHAGHLGPKGAGNVGVYGGDGANLYLIKHLLPSFGLGAGSSIADLLGLMNGNSTGSLCTRVAYKLDLRGPAVTVHTECSTSLVAVHMACQALLAHDCDTALAGGVWLNLLQDGGYRHQAGAILSPDGHCRAFDARAEGTVIGSGAGIVVLKRLSEALRDGDTIHAVIKGSAVNNDGTDKIGFTAPSVQGQADVIRAAQMLADVSADTIGYIEAHGTGTTLGDPIEVAALTQAFSADTPRRGFCAIGSVKTNVGHLDAAAGVAGLIKAVMALRHAMLPPSLNFEVPNPRIDFDGSPFYVNTRAQAWPAGATPRRAGVSSFGIGGTNAHVVLEEAPVVASAAAHGDQVRLLRLSARSAEAVEAMGQRLADHLARPDAPALADAAHTLRVGRRRLAHRAVALARGGDDAVHALRTRGEGQYFQGTVLSESPGVAFLFPGQGAQYPGMGRELHDREPVYRDAVDHCCQVLLPVLGLDLRTLIHPAPGDEAQAAEQLGRTAFTQPALFVVEYAMARLWMSWGVVPDAMLGHSVGEYVAACLAGVFSLQDALAVVTARGRLMQSTQAGAMLAVSLPESDLGPWLREGCDLAAINAADRCVLSGLPAAIDAAEQALARREVGVRRLHVSHAFHSALVEPVLVEFEAMLSQVARHAPRIPFVSNVTGRWITDEEATSTDYWVRHMRGSVRFAEGLDELLSRPDRVLLEVGPGDTLSGLARRQVQGAFVARPVLNSQAHPQRPQLQADQPARCLAQLWVAGVAVDEGAWQGDAPARRVPLPTYPFEHQSFWIEPSQPSATVSKATPAVQGMDGWFHVPAWTRLPAGAMQVPARFVGSVLVLGQAGSLADRLVERLRAQGLRVAFAMPGAGFVRTGPHSHTVQPTDRHDLEQWLRAAQADLGPVSAVCHLLSVDGDEAGAPSAAVLDRGFFSLLALAQALDAVGGGDRRVALTVVGNQVEDVSGLDVLNPEKSTLQGPCKVIPQEYPAIGCRLVDVIWPTPGSAAEAQIVEQLTAQVCRTTVASPADGEAVIACRGPNLWVRRHEPLYLTVPGSQRLRSGGVYLITGGLGGIGLSLARHLAKAWRAKLVLVSRGACPARADWARLAEDAAQTEAMRSRCARLAELERLGAEVLVVQADVADAVAMASAVRQAKDRFGAVHGVIHAAGEAGGGMIALKTREAAERVFAAKLAGTRSLMATLANEPLDFVVLCSSLTALAGGFGQVDYCAANAVLDAMAIEASRHGDRHVVSINWDAWHEVGMAAAHVQPDGVGLTPEQGAQVFERLLAGPALPQVIVSTADLAWQIERTHQPSMGDHLPISAPATARTQHHARPALQTAYAEPATDLEEGLAALWSEFLGISPIGVDDHLFELGGDSLMAIQLLAKVRGAYGVEVHPSVFFKAPTVAALAELVELKLIEEIEAAGAADTPHTL